MLRIAEAEREGWRGEVEGLSATLAAARDKLGRLDVPRHPVPVAGSGPTVVLLHSSICDRRMWDPQWHMLLDAGYRVVRCDFRGHGGSPAPTEPFNAADDVKNLLDILDVREATVIGASYGGRVAQEIAARWPKRVTTLVLLCAAMRLHPPTEAIIAFSTSEDELLDAGDIAGAVALNVATFLGPAASVDTRAAVTAMQQLTFEVQIAATRRNHVTQTSSATSTSISQR